ncbi:hypothetical protein CC1G_13465 [Coprinopsis cinerea okayama7|uniref:Uncharacterized protein n=1 Tax=Coprinopsis cinerea (strain Okayama-7 / 130 / ATCC MYA-4618 / FGSC 9003) TaxID=240176 RepID=A8P2P5_COPC7|nr:hypothetical protein CC1G_13465 [Coprinopsis cinerea okayama7\|eukprot:XP_001838376.2 hypothetical protein CC1G_13465 [Coprinopsis cinerea okayama7\
MSESASTRRVSKRKKAAEDESENSSGGSGGTGKGKGRASSNDGNVAVKVDPEGSGEGFIERIRKQKTEIVHLRKRIAELEGGNAKLTRRVQELTSTVTKSDMLAKEGKNCLREASVAISRLQEVIVGEKEDGNLWGEDASDTA